MDYKDLYEKLFVAGYDPAAVPEEWAAHYKNLTDRLKADFPPPAKVLDVGCAFGAAMGALRQWGYDANGIDPSATAIKGVCGALVGVANKIPFENTSFDCIICTDVLEHIEEKDIPDVVLEFNRVLKPKGKAYCHIATIPECDRTPIDGLHARGEYSNLSNLHVSILSSKTWQSYFEVLFKTEIVDDQSGRLSVIFRL